MKNYPILSLKDFMPYKVYNNSYLEELNKIVFSLFQYSEYQVPDYKKVEQIDPEEDGKIDATKLNFHTYYQLDKDRIIILGNSSFSRECPAGTIIISNARAEGTVDHATPINNKELLDPNNYFFQPKGWGSYYIPYYRQKIIDGEIKNVYTFIYDQYAEEIYGKSLYFSFDTYFSRYFTNQEIGRTFENNVNSEVVLSARDNIRDINYITDRQGKIWSTYLTNPVMGFTFLQNYTLDTENEKQYDKYDYGEEIIIDSKWEVSTFERTNIARYTIMSRYNKKDWPTDNHSIMADII